MKCTCSRTLNSFDLWEAYKEVAEMNKTFTYFKESKHVECLKLVGNESKIQHGEFSTVKLEILFKANSPQESNLALLEIIQAATMLFQRSIVDEYPKWNTEIGKLAKRNIDIGLLKELNSLGPKCLIEVISLNSLTDEKLDEYCELYREKEKLSLAQIYNIKCSH